jgi:hypothetical protein
LLTGLTPGTDYYFAAISTINGSQYTSPTFLFVTTNYATTNALFDLTNVWTFMTADLDGVNWTAPTYDDSAWDGSGPGVLWVDTRGAPQDGLPDALNTQLPSDPNTLYPFVTYYFRTHFNFTNSLARVTLLFEDYVDDGAVFYLNGTEIYRLRMAPAPTPILNATKAVGYPCSDPNSPYHGNAACPDDWSISGSLTTNLVAGDNVLAVEVHNYDSAHAVPQSPDITFGLSLSYAEPNPPIPQLQLVSAPGTLTLNWTRPGFTLQTANALTGPWTDVPGPVISSPFTTNLSGPSCFFRLRK